MIWHFFPGNRDSARRSLPTERRERLRGSVALPRGAGGLQERGVAGGGIAGIWPLTGGTAARTLLVALSFTTISAQHFAGHGAGIHPAMANAPEGEHSALNDLLTIHAVRIAPSPEGHPEFSASAPQPMTDWARIRFGWRAAVGRRLRRPPIQRLFAEF